MIRVGLYANQLARWNGGLEFLQRLTDSLVFSEQYKRRATLFLVVGIDEPYSTYLSALFYKKLKLCRLILKSDHAITLLDSIQSSIAAVNVEHCCSPYSKLIGFLKSYLDQELSVLFFDISRPWGLQLGITYAQIQVLLPLIEPPPQRLSIPYIAYLYDLQHLHMPWYFSSEERNGRADCFNKLKQQAHALMFNSHYILHEFASCYGLPDRRPVFSLPFAPQARAEWLNNDFLSPHGSSSSRPYLVVCNQFWIHKNHMIVLEAFEQISHLCDLDLVFTGALHDYRGHEHIMHFLDKLTNMSELERVHVLGDVPKLQQIHILSHATMLIQPSTYEGGPGGGAVYDAIAMGVPVLLSDIEVNRECLSPWYMDFFSTNDSSDLASKILKYMNQNGYQRVVDASSLNRLTGASRDAVAQTLIECLEETLSWR
jgi:glycosyltransferase involved in cell wall biosynthesis